MGSLPTNASLTDKGLSFVQRSALPLHPFHMVALSPWPILTSMSVFGLLCSAALWFNSLSGAGQAVLLGFTAVLAMMANWFKDVSSEAALMGLHTKVVAKAHVMGMGLFITTEVNLTIT
jgi:hypothetical protein